MSKRARYDGPHESVLVYDSEGSVYDPPIAEVKRGGLLPADAPARVRDDLTSGDDWTEVEHADGAKAKGDA